jgi:ElaB/YqjD/DUF883 family membrane-anchored ribosome-binding protein
MVLIEREGLSPELLQLAAEAEEFLRESAKFYRTLASETQGAADDPPAKVRDRLHEYRKVAMSALEDGRRVAEELNRARGIIRDYALDLRAARMEVERLLDRFAAERRQIEVPRQLE